MTGASYKAEPRRQGRAQAEPGHEE